jgi:hypothetical protein
MLRRPHKIRRHDDGDDIVRKPAPQRGLAAKLARGEDVTLAGHRFDGRYVVIGLILFVFVFAVGLWWALNWAYYKEFRANTVVIAGNTYNVSRFQGIDSDSSPIRLRACFLIEGRVLAPPAENPVPLVAPGWFKCFKAEYIAREIAEGTAIAYLAEHNKPFGFDRIVAVSSGGRAFMWRQPNGNLAE